MIILRFTSAVSFYLIFFLLHLCKLSFFQKEKAKVIQTLLFVAGLNTLLQTWFGTRLPVVIGGSYTFVAPTISIILSGRWSEPDPEKVRNLDSLAGAPCDLVRMH